MNIRLIIPVFLLLLFQNLSAQEEVYELRTYELEVFRPAEVLHTYFEKALLPALNRQGIKNVGVFEETSDNLPKKIFLLIPYATIQDFQDSAEKLIQDEAYLSDANDYLKASETTIPYIDYSTNLIRSTFGFPNLIKPNPSLELLELRIYHSPNEDGLRRKVKMFNDAEFPIFKDAGLTMVFFGADIAGDHMPCLTYMLAVKDKEAHEKGWQAFINHPEWKRITKIEEYANSMNNITRIFLKRLPYSQL